GWYEDLLRVIGTKLIPEGPTIVPMFERLGGPEVRAVAERHPRTLRRVGGGVCPRRATGVQPQPLDPDVLARVRLKLEVGNKWFRRLAVDLLPELPRIRCPTLVLGGELDPICPVADSQDIAAEIPEAELRIVEGAAHGVFRDKPEEAVAIIRDFILR